MKNQVIASFGNYNHRRYSSPWVCKMKDDGKCDFSQRVGIYTGDYRNGEAGDLVVYEPIDGQVYGYGQKDYRGNNTEVSYVKYDGENFIPCDKLGRVKEQI